jgi:hypothetical protein
MKRRETPLLYGIFMMSDKELDQQAPGFLPNVKDEPRLQLARAVRKHGT